MKTPFTNTRILFPSFPHMHMCMYAHVYVCIRCIRAKRTRRNGLGEKPTGRNGSGAKRIRAKRASGEVDWAKRTRLNGPGETHGAKRTPGAKRTRIGSMHEPQPGINDWPRARTCYSERMGRRRHRRPICSALLVLSMRPSWIGIAYRFTDTGVLSSQLCPPKHGASVGVFSEWLPD